MAGPWSLLGLGMPGPRSLPRGGYVQGVGIPKWDGDGYVYGT